MNSKRLTKQMKHNPALVECLLYLATNFQINVGKEMLALKKERKRMKNKANDFTDS